MIEKLYMMLSFWDIFYLVGFCATMALLSIIEQFEDKSVLIITYSFLWPITLLTIVFITLFLTIASVWEEATKAKR